jgi:mono/diheme cytochrome c family protein
MMFSISIGNRRFVTTSNGRLNTSSSKAILLGAAFMISAALVCGSISNAGALQERSGALAENRAVQGDSQRGGQTFFIKCNFCHAPIARWAPPLNDLYKREKAIAGRVWDDELVREQILNGSGNMPSFRYSLSETELADIMSYLRDGKCCPDASRPPSNPRYRFQ